MSEKDGTIESAGAVIRDVDTKGDAPVKVILDATNVDDIRLAENGHKAQLHRQYGLMGVVALGIVATNSWTAVAGTLVAGISAGGPPTIIYGYILVTVMNLFIAASLGELASSYPTAGGAYHWAAKISTPEWSAFASFITGYLNLFAWIVGTAGSDLVLGQFVMALVNLCNPDFVIQRWQIFVCYQGWNISATLMSIYGNRLMPLFIRFSMFWTLTACVITTIVMLSVSPEKQTAKKVFATFTNQTGWSNNGIVVCVGLLNPAFGYAAIDATVHYSEETKDAERNVPKALMYVVAIGFVSGLLFLIAAFFSVVDYDAVITTPTLFPIAEIYRQASGQAGGIALTLMLFFATIPALYDCQIATTRLMWAFARDNALPFSNTWKYVHPTLQIPIWSSLFVGVAEALLGCIYIGNTTAFFAFISSAIVLNNLTYAAPVVANMLRGRKHFRVGRFHMRGMLGWVVNIMMVGWTLFTLIFFEFPAYLPLTAANMNYTVVMISSCGIFSLVWWIVRGRKTYDGPVVEVILEVRE